jgi:outer membrane protein assembly factor BamB
MRRWGTLVSVVLGALAFSGCGWLQLGAGADRSGFNGNETAISAANVHTLQTAWSATVPDHPHPALKQGNSVHVVSPSAYTQLNATTGGVVWQEIIEEQSGLQPFFYPPALLDGKVHVPASIFGRWGGTWVFDPASQTYTGQLTSGFASGSALAVRSDTSAVVVGQSTSGGSILFLQYGPHQGFLNFTGPGALPPTSDPALVGTHAVVSHGTTVVSFPVGQCPEPPPEVPSGLPGCWPEWIRNLGGLSSMPVGVTPALIAVGTQAGDVVVLNAADGTTAFSADLGSTTVTAPAVAYNTIYAGNAEGTLAALPTSGCTSCTPQWTANIGAAITTQPAVAGGVVFVGAADGRVHAFDAAGCGAATCAELWSAEIDPNADEIAPIVTGGALFVTADTGTVKAFALS